MKYHSAQNDTFQGDDPTWANACVGNNGSPQIIDYAEGFASAANVLLDEVIKHEGNEHPVDIFIYPICFNMRHAVELYLKATVADLLKLADKRSVKIKPFDMLGSHNLGKIWEYVKLSSLATDKRYELVIDAMDDFVKDIAEVDATGQVFRYPFDTEVKKHLTDIALINVFLLKSRFNALETQLKNLNRLNTDLLEEYQWGSFTNKLSRVQLIRLASELPERGRWSDPSFLATKSDLQAKYELSSNDFCKAINIIQKHYEMATLIGITVDISGLNFQVLKSFFDIWSKLHDIEDVRNPPLYDVKEQEFLPGAVLGIADWHLTRTQCIDTLAKTVTPNCIAVLNALYYFYGFYKYSEEFDLLLKLNKEETLHNLYTQKDFEISILHLLDKTNALENTLNSLNFLGQNQLLSSLIKEYDLEACKDRLLHRSESRKIKIGM